jgi:uncharacterized protein YceK
MKILTKTAAIALSILVLASSTGCVSLLAHATEKPPKAYSGVQHSMYSINNPTGGYEYVVVTPMIVIDLPLTFALDTLLLPFDLIGAAAAKNKQEAKSQPEETPQPPPLP